MKPKELDMKTIRETRHENFHRLFQMYKERVWKAFPDQPERGMLRHMARAFEMSERFLSHMKTDAKAMGGNVARDLERAMGLPEGWMDTDHGDKKTTSEEEFLSVMSMLYRTAPLEAMKLMTKELTRHLSIDTVLAQKSKGTSDDDSGSTPAPKTSKTRK